MTEATKKISRRIQDVSDDDDDEEVGGALLFLSINAGRRDVSSSRISSLGGSQLRLVAIILHGELDWLTYSLVAL